jgi:hypothetical protein
VGDPADPAITAFVDVIARFICRTHSGLRGRRPAEVEQPCCSWPAARWCMVNRRVCLLIAGGRHNSPGRWLNGTP